MPMLLQLEWYGEGVAPCEPTVLCGTCAMSQKTVQNAGRAFWDKFEFSESHGSIQQDCDEEDNDKNEQQLPKDRENAFKERKAKRDREQKERDGGLLKMSEDLKGKDLYELLEVEASCSADDIKKAYRKLALVHHPDKMTDPTEEQKKHFLLIQEAFDLLSDPTKRRRYESTLKFDDSIPSDLRKGYPDNFFSVFQPVFKRNARWSSRPRVPDLGDEETPIEQVKTFYEFWRNFDSWRDPLAIAEQDEVELQNLEEAECREEKRWMERENAKIARKIKQGERERISDLVKIAEKHDPRMKAYRAQVLADKEAEKARRAAAEEAEKMRLEAEARERAEVAEAARLVEAEKKQAEKKAKEEAKGALKSARQRVRGLHRNAKPIVRHAVHIDQLQEVCLRLSTEELCQLASAMEAALANNSDDCSDVVELLHNEIKKYGATPIEDDSVQLKPEDDSESTATPDSSNEEENVLRQELESSPDKIASGPTQEEIDAKRALEEAKEAEERAKREQKAEDQRKKREQKKKDEEKREAALRRAEAAQRAKDRKAQEKAATNGLEKVQEKGKGSGKEPETSPQKGTAPEVQPCSDNTGIGRNTILLVTEDAVVFASPESSQELSTISEGSFLVASGPPVNEDGYDMVPLQPCGSVELRVVRRVVSPDTTKTDDAESVRHEVQETVDVVPQAVAPSEGPAKSTKKSEKLPAEDEDLDGILTEFGIVLQPVAKTSKKKNKK